ncbi:hypothetical protein D3Z39_10200 [Anaerotruncus colihominis]|uniref:Dipeptidase n=1 Tax=Anaerotruncus colihominis TaxID=169435 RepID=A0A845RNJ3_9FIRM|nr:C69 family dipeptidase [Anaerotruncus colihominis]NBI79232.1 hypothetical protein [Anaerotruncus colihominis]
MCTCLIAGKKATISGRAMLAANDDWEKIPGVLTHTPRRGHVPGETYLLTAGGRIPEIAETCGYSYTACKYNTGTLDRSWAGGVNDCGVAVAGTGASAFKAIPCEDALLEPDDIPLLVLTRGTSARQAVRMLGELIRQYGIRYSGLEGCESMATYSIADAEEGWFLEVAPGNHWVAVRVPDDQVAVRPNALCTHDADLTDTENVLASPGLAEYAREQGWWDGDIHHFDFAAAYGSDVSPNEWGPELDRMNLLRRWRAVSLFSGKDMPYEDLTYSVVPNRLLSMEDFKNALRDLYQGTPYDLSKAPGAGRYGDPFHDDPPEYALCRRWTVASFVADFRKEGAPVMWVSMGCPKTSCYIPLYADISDLPACCEETEPGKDTPSLFWSFQALHFLTCRRYSENIPLVEAALTAYEQEADEALASIHDKLAALPADRHRAEQTAFTHRQIQQALTLCRDTHTALLYRY